MKMIRIGAAPAGSTPFRKEDGRVIFDGQDGRMADYGHAFDAERGYRVFWKFRDSIASNTWGPGSLIEWANEVEPADDATRELLRIARQQAQQCITLNAEWIRLGRPADGVSTEPKGTA